MSEYDSTADTLRHSRRVGELLVQFGNELLERATRHDLSKTEEPELSAFNEMTPRLAETEYGSHEYKAALEALGPALTHHYAHNRHHPEHFPDGVTGMTLVDVVEMLADWKAAGERTAGGSLSQSIAINKSRYNLDPQVFNILLNTAVWLGWLT